MKKMFFYASLLLAAATLNSCSQDSDLSADEAATAAADALTPEQKAQIMELAKRSGQNFHFYETAPMFRSSQQKENLDTLAAIFRQLAYMEGDYTCISAQDGEAVFTKGKCVQTRVRRLSSGFLETQGGSFIDEVSGFGGGVIIVRVTWSVGSTTGPGTVSVSIDHDLSNYEASFDVTEATFYGLNAFTFKGKAKFYVRSGYLTKSFVGGYSDGHGYVSISSF